MDGTSLTRALRELPLNPEEYIVAGSGLLAALSLREANDIDLVVSEEAFERLGRLSEWTRRLCSDGSDYLVNGAVEVWTSWDDQDDLPNLLALKSDQLVLDGVPYVSPVRLLHWKRRTARPKDVPDMALLEHHLLRQS